MSLVWDNIDKRHVIKVAGVPVATFEQSKLDPGVKTDQQIENDAKISLDTKLSIYGIEAKIKITNRALKTYTISVGSTGFRVIDDAALVSLPTAKDIENIEKQIHS